MTATAPSSYITTQAETLEKQTPVAPSEARAAQIPLKDFNLPTFPQEAFSAGLTSLLLMADIKLDEYSGILGQPFSIPKLPDSVTSLTLELFSLGYPPGFLLELAKNLPNLKSLTLYSQLFFGTLPPCEEDALTFIKLLPRLQEVHFLDVFGPSASFAKLAKSLTPSVKFLEINYTYRHSDPKFLDAVPSREIVALLRGGTVGFTASISAPDMVETDQDDREGTEEGILAAGGRGASRALVTKLQQTGRDLVLLDCTMFTLSATQVATVLESTTKLKVLSITLALDNGWEDAIRAVGANECRVEVLEMVGVPGKALVESIENGGATDLTAGVMECFVGWRELKSVRVSLLRTREEQWIRDAESWKKA